jgi:hypothetical protein
MKLSRKLLNPPPQSIRNLITNRMNQFTMKKFKWIIKLNHTDRMKSMPPFILTTRQKGTRMSSQR